MAVGGRKPKPAHLRVVEGNPGKRPIPPDVGAMSPPDDHVPLPRPKYIRAASRAGKLWAEVSVTCWWLGEADAYKLSMWCVLQAEFEKSPENMTASRIAQLRALGSELGFDPAARARLGSIKGAKKPEEKGNGKYFD